MNETLLSVKQFASKIGVHPSTVRRAIAFGRIHAFRVGAGKKAQYRIRETELERMMAFDLTDIIENRAKELNENKTQNV